jgi:phospholipase C
VTRTPALAALAACAALAGCSGGTASIPTSTTGVATAHRAAGADSQPAAAARKSKIQHVVIVVQENRSFDNLFQGYPGANTVSSGKNSKGQTIALQPEGLEADYQVNHELSDYIAACDGTGSIPGTDCRMDGFDKELAAGPGAPSNPQYAYVPAAETKPYFAMAGQYVLADDMFTSHIDASFVSHQYIIAGQAGGAVDLPSGLWGCGGVGGDSVETLTAQRVYGPTIAPCFTYATIASELEAKGLTWHFYSAGPSDGGYLWSAYQAIGPVYNGPDWTSEVVQNPAQFLTDVAAGTLANVTWVTPTDANSDHAGAQSKSGPQWVTSVVNAVGESKFWKNTTIFVMWDEWGGWYDHVAPPYVDYDGLGIRVPLLILSPYAKHGYVSHVQYEHGSILKYVEDTFGLARLAASDTRANSPVPDAIDYKQKPRAFKPFPTALKPADFIDAPPDTRPPDEE